MASFSSVFAPVKEERQGEEEAASFLRVLVYPRAFETRLVPDVAFALGSRNERPLAKSATDTVCSRLSVARKPVV